MASPYFKTKGLRLQQWFREALLSEFKKHIHESWITSTPGGVTGEDIQLTREARERLAGFTFECKRRDKPKDYDFYAAFNQCSENAAKLKTEKPAIPAVIFKKGNTEPMAFLEAIVFVKLLKRTYQIRRLKMVVSDIKKMVEDMDDSVPEKGALLALLSEIGNELEDVPPVEHLLVEELF